VKTAQRTPHVGARANTLVLVTAILVLLVIIATAFLVRSQSGRAQAAAQQKSVAREARVETIAADIAQEVADALFVKRIDRSRMAEQVAANRASGLTNAIGLSQMRTQSTNPPLPYVIDNGENFARSDFPRLPPEPLAIRYGVDYFDFFDNRTVAGDPALGNGMTAVGEDGYLDGYNFAPFSVIPATNWPARYGAIPGEANSPGNPGFGDSRWLASTEPVRARLRQQEQNIVAPAPPGPQQPLPFTADWGNLALNGLGSPILDPEGLGFSHWPHLSWIATAENGFRVAWNIANLEGGPLFNDFLGNEPGVLTGTPGTVGGELALGIPYEQWLPFVAPREPTILNKDPATGFLVLNRDAWRLRVRDWFNVGITNLALNAVGTHEQVTKGVDGNGVGLIGPAAAQRRADALPNFLQLGAFGTPADEFKVIPLANNTSVPTSRNLISRTFADADGDGWTDSFWFLAPTSSDRGTRQLVAVRIIDNSSMINVNTATRFERSNTIGATPSDVALVTRRESYDETVAAGNAAGFRDPIVGFFNARENDPEYRVNFAFRTLLPAPAPSPALNADRLVYAVADDGQTPAVPTGGIDVGWAPERWEGRRSQPANPGATGVDSYQPGFLRLLGLISEGAPGQANAVLPFFNAANDYALNGAGGLYGDAFVLTRPADRLNYFKAMANGGEIVDPVTAARITSLTPFGSDDEIELRSSNGLNNAQTISRLEIALNGAGSLTSTDVVFGQFLRSTRSREETARFFDPDDVRVQDWRSRSAWAGPNATFASRSGAELLLDHRRLMTTISGARNDLLPPRLWTIVDHSSHPPTQSDEDFAGDVRRSRPAYTRRGIDLDLNGQPDDVTGDGQVTGADDLAPYHPNIMFPGATLIQPGANNPFGFAHRDATGDGTIDVRDFERARQRFLVDNRKIDLRRPNDEPVFDPATNSMRVARGSEILTADRKLAADVQRVMRRALVDEENRQSYFGRPGQGTGEADASLRATKLMAASFAANLLSWRDGERRFSNVLYMDQPLHPGEAVPVPQDAVGTAPIQDAAFIGVEKQPFIQEVFIAFVYPKSKLSQAEIDAVVGPVGGPTIDGCPDPANCQLSTTDPYALPPCTTDGAGEHFVTFDPLDTSTRPAIVFVAQIANPFNEPVNLADFELWINPAPPDPAYGGTAAPQRLKFAAFDPTGRKSGNIYGPDVELGPCTPEEPRSAIVFAIPQFFPNGDPFPRDAWLDFLDIGAPVADLDPSNDTQPGEAFEPDSNALFYPAWGSQETANRRGGTLLFDVTTTATFPNGLESTGDISRYRPPVIAQGALGPALSFIELRRVILGSTPATPAGRVVVDRLDNELDVDGSDQQFASTMKRMFDNDTGGGLPPERKIECRSGSLAIDGIRMRLADQFVVWARASRQWLWDTQNGLPLLPDGSAPVGRGVITADERAPRWALSRLTGTMGSTSRLTQTPDVEAVVNSQLVTAARKGSLVSLNTRPDGEAPNATNAITGIDPLTLPLWAQYVNQWGEQKRGKPVFFGSRIVEGTTSRRYDYPAWGVAFDALPVGMKLNYGEKAVTDLKFVNGSDPTNFVAPLRLYQKDADFDQVAEILDVPMWGPLVSKQQAGGPNNYPSFATLPEILAQPADSNSELLFPKSPKPALSTNVPAFGAFPAYINKLQIEPAQYDVKSSPGSRPALLTGVQSLPAPIERVTDAVRPTRFPLPTTPKQQNGIGFNSRLVGGAALLDAFTIDDRGAAPFDAWTSTSAPDGQISFGERASAEDRRARLSRNFEGKITPGLININTAPVEVLRAMPQMLRLVYDDDFPIVRTADSNPSQLNVPSSELGRRRTVRTAGLWELSPYDLGGGNPGPGNAGSILFDYGVAAPRVRVAEAIDLWRNKSNVSPTLVDRLYPQMPSYYSRGLDLTSTTVDNPDDVNYREWAPDSRSDRGFDSLGELALLTKGADFSPASSADGNGNGTPDVVDVMLRKASDVNRNNVDDLGDVSPSVASTGTDLISWNQAMGWSIRFAGQDPYRTKWNDPTWGKGRNAIVDTALASLGPGTRWTDGIPKTLPAGGTQAFPLTGRTAIDKHLLVVATDDRNTGAVIETNDTLNDGLNTGGLTKYTETKAYRYDHTAGDAMEQNQILKGISNIATTRSDVFTVWVRIRTIKQDRLTGQWNGTDPELIVDDSRYMMTIDRSSVDRPGEKPRIVSFVKVPN